MRKVEALWELADEARGKRVDDMASLKITERDLTPDFLGLYRNPIPLFVERITIHKRRMALRIPFETSFGRFDSLVRLYPEITFRIEGGGTVTGVGECSPLSAP